MRERTQQIHGETIEMVTDFICLGSKITADGDCSQKMLTPWKKSYDQPRQHIKKQRHRFVRGSTLIETAHPGQAP